MRAREAIPLLLLLALGAALTWHVQAEEPPPSPWARVRQVVEQVGPAVVRIEVAGSKPRGDRPRRRLFRQVETREGGAGVVVGPRRVLTHASLVRFEDARFTVTTSPGTRYSARLVRLDSARELALLETEGRLDVRPARLGQSATLPQGTLLVALGDPFGTARDAQATASLGVLEGRVVLDAAEVSFHGRVLLTTAAINPGCEGGPLLDLSGQVVGVLAPLAEDRRVESLLGHAIPVEEAKQLMAEAAEQGLHLGFQGRALEGGGVEVVILEAGGPAARAGLHAGDVIRAVDDQPVGSGADLRRLVEQGRGPLRLGVEREGAKLELELRLEEDR